MVDAGGISRGQELLAALESASFPVDAAAWQLEDETGRWRLVITSREYDEQGPLAAYTRIGEVLNRSKIDLDLSSVRVVSPRDHAMTLLSGMARTGAVRAGTMLSDVYFGPFYLPSLYVYPMETTRTRTPSAKPSSRRLS